MPPAAVVPVFDPRIDAEAWLIQERTRVEEPEVWQPLKERLELQRRAAEAKRLPTLRSYAEQWLERRRNSKGEPFRALTRDKYESSLRVHVYPTFGDRPLDQISRVDVRSWHAGLDAGASPRAHAYSTL